MSDDPDTLSSPENKEKSECNDRQIAQSGIVQCQMTPTRSARLKTKTSSVTIGKSLSGMVQWPLTPIKSTRPKMTQTREQLVPFFLSSHTEIKGKYGTKEKAVRWGISGHHSTHMLFS